MGERRSGVKELFISQRKAQQDSWLELSWFEKPQQDFSMARESLRWWVMTRCKWLRCWDLTCPPSCCHPSLTFLIAPRVGLDLGRWEECWWLILLPPAPGTFPQLKGHSPEWGPAPRHTERQEASRPAGTSLPAVQDHSVSAPRESRPCSSKGRQAAAPS